MLLDQCNVLEYIKTKHDHPYGHTDDHMKESIGICHSVLEAVAYLHSIGICHSDIKPEHNLMMEITNENPKALLAGLDHAIPHETETISEPLRGTPCYAAPEILQHKTFKFKENAKCKFFFLSKSTFCIYTLYKKWILI